MPNIQKIALESAISGGQVCRGAQYGAWNVQSRSGVGNSGGSYRVQRSIGWLEARSLDSFALPNSTKNGTFL